MGRCKNLGSLKSFLWYTCCHFCHVWLFATLWTIAFQAPLSMGFSRQEYWSVLPCPPPGDLPGPWIEPASLVSSALAGRFFKRVPPGKKWKWKSLSHVQLFVTPWTAALKAPLSMEFPRWEYWSGALPDSSAGDLPNPRIKPMSPILQVDSLPSESPGKTKNTRVDSLSLLQGIFPTQELNQGLLHCRQILYQLSYQGSVTWEALLWYAPQLSGASILFSHPEFPQGYSLMAARWQVFLPSWVSSGLTNSPSVMAAITDDYNILCLLIWQEIFHFLG